jgi:hypothetical protein
LAGADTGNLDEYGNSERIDAVLPYHYYFIMLMALLTMLLLRGRRLFDDVLEAMHRDHHDAWEAAGRPGGFFWQPEDGAAWLDSTRARKVIFRDYMRNIPDWMPEDDPLKARLLWSRISVSLSYLGFAGSGLLLLFLQIAT